MHQTIQHIGLCCCLDIWRLEVVQRNKVHATLEAFAASQPSLSELRQIANYLALNCVANGAQIQKACERSAEVHDEQYENTLLLTQYFLLYEELTFLMNHSDIMHLEACYFSWICIFRVTGKHKYSKWMIKHLLNLYHVYPPCLR